MKGAQRRLACTGCSQMPWSWHARLAATGRATRQRGCRKQLMLIHACSPSPCSTTNQAKLADVGWAQVRAGWARSRSEHGRPGLLAVQQAKQGAGQPALGDNSNVAESHNAPPTPQPLCDPTDSLPLVHHRRWRHLQLGGACWGLQGRGGAGGHGLECLPMPICLIQEIGVRVANCGRSLWF